MPVVLFRYSMAPGYGPAFSPTARLRVVLWKIKSEYWLNDGVRCAFLAAPWPR
jgi:hypothetical protein